MREIPLSQGLVALVDDDDYPELIKYKWCAHKGQNTFYAEKVSRRMGVIRMHRIILGVPDGLFTDHINGNGLDNRKENLRIVTNRENSQNRHQIKTSIRPGVWWSKNNKKWTSSIRVGKKRVNLGCFETEDMAYIAYQNACNSLDNITVSRKLTTSKHPGVYWNKNSKKWYVQIQMGHRTTKYLGTYSDEIEAATVYRVAREVLLNQAIAKKGARA